VYVSKDFDENSQGWNITKFNNIQDGVDAVAGSGTIFVYNGSYNENLIIDKPLNLIGEDKHTTEIIGDGNGDVIKIFDETTISGFTIKNSGMSQDNSAIKIYSKMNIIKNNTIKENNYGIKIETSAENDIIENVINKNNFINNNIHTEDYNNNRFFGNYWDNYSGKDTNEDGIGDTPYNFESGSDLCPFYLESGWDSGINHQPVIPIISGPSTGKPNTPYSYDFVTADPDGDKVYIFIDMADGAFKNWVGPFDSCEVKNMIYYWERIGVYTIKAKAKDEYGVETDWITHKLTIPRYRTYDFPRYTLIDLFLNLLRIIRNFK
jgi:parallel beta-helix repeat protein